MHSATAAQKERSIRVSGENNGRQHDGHCGWTRVRKLEQELEAKLADVQDLRDRLQAENAYLQEEVESVHDHHEIVGGSDAMRLVMQQVELVAITDTNVLITGETGTGKELVARAVHSLSSRRKRPLVRVNCAALPPSLIESELFGHEKGAFTGALMKRIGRFELADGGTIFLDEIGDLPTELQAKLLRVLQEGEFERLGSTKTLRVNVRVVAATNRNLEEAMTVGRFREDLYYRLKVFPIHIPPLRARRDDILILVWHFINKNQPKMGKKITKIPNRIVEALRAYDWPGNVRQLENIVESALVVSVGSRLTLRESPFEGAGNNHSTAPENPSVQMRQDPACAPNLTLEEFERRHILSILRKTAWRVKGSMGAAELLGLKPTTLNSRMKKLGITRPANPFDESL